MKFRLELDEADVVNLIKLINVAPITGNDAEGVAELKAKIGSGTAIVEVEPEAVSVNGTEDGNV